jgi:hypothetical protein
MVDSLIAEKYDVDEMQYRVLNNDGASNLPSIIALKIEKNSSVNIREATRTSYGAF